MIFRENYIEQLIPFIDKPIIKVLTGIRRSGKSTILAMLKAKLIERGVKEERILFINFESFKYSSLLEGEALYNFVEQNIEGEERYYLLLDEIQEVNGWEKGVNSFMVDFNIDITITGSNSHLLSSELATYLAGRYIEIPVHTLSYSEFLEFNERYFQLNNNITPTENEIALSNKEPTSSRAERELFNRYLRFGGFPIIHKSNYSLESAYKIVFDIYSSVILRDTIQRYKIRDVELLERVIRYAFDNIGSTFSGKNVADYFKSQQRRVDLNTVYNYLNALEGSFLLYKVPRYDIKGREILKTMEKYYLADISLLYATMGFKDRKISGLLENIVFLELKRRGYSVYIGKLNGGEVDFIAEKRGEKRYIQVAYKLESEKTIDREFTPLLAIADQYPKYVVTMDDFWKESIDGVEHLHIVDFLMTKTL